MLPGRTGRILTGRYERQSRQAELHEQEMRGQCIQGKMGEETSARKEE